jgi:hypothetical protein
MLNWILTKFSDPEWVLTAVFTAIVINVFSYYLTRALDKFFSKISSWWRDKSAIRKKAWEERVNKMVASHDERETAIADELRTRLKTLFLLLLSVILFCCSLLTGIVFSAIIANLLRIIFLVFSTLFLFAGFLGWELAESTEAELKEARNRLKKQVSKEKIDA